MTNESKLAFGIGFHPRTNEYKVVRIVEKEQPMGLEQEQLVGLEQHIEVFTLGKQPMWMINRKNPFLLRMQHHAVSFNGALHWLGQDKQNGSTIIVSFDLESEEFQQIPTPDNCDKSGLDRQDCHVVVLGECLCVVDYDEFDRIDIWSMKIYGAKESWIKEYTVEPLDDSMAVYKIRIRDLRDLPPRHSFRAVSVVDENERICTVVAFWLLVNDEATNVQRKSDKCKEIQQENVGKVENQLELVFS
nr:F-box protein At3g07870-like [Quercus suber]